LSSVDSLLEETRLRLLPPEETWIAFSEIVRSFIRSPDSLVYAQHTDKVALDGPATDICRNALREIYKAVPAKSKDGKQLREPTMKKLWTDLTHI
jgi:hypothetical protein